MPENIPSSSSGMFGSVPVYGAVGGCVFSVVLLGGMLLLCVGFKRKQKKGFSLHEPVRLLFKHDRSQYAEPTVSNGSSNGHIHPETAHRLGVRTHSPTWRNSSLSRELPAIPDGNGVMIRPLGHLTSYESASNLYACLDDVRVGHDDSHPEPTRAPSDPQSSASSAESAFQAVNGQRRVHPYDRIGGPSTSATALSSSLQSVPVNARSVPSSHNHAQILQQMDNDAAMADYRGEARSDMSYTSITVRAPLSNLRTTRRSVEDGYSNVPGAESHLYAQVGGEYGGSVTSGELGSHIYNELYAEIDARNSGPVSSPQSPPLIDPYATSAGRHPPPDEPVPSTSRGRPEDVEKLYAKIHKPSGSGQKKSFSDPEHQRTVGNQPRRRQSAPMGERRYESERRVVSPTEPVYENGMAGGGGHNSLYDIRAALNVAIDGMDASLDEFVQDARDREYRKEHLYEQLPDV